MGNAIFPALPGITWNSSKSPEFKTQTHRSVSGRELRGSFQQYPLYTFNLNYEVLRDGAMTELKRLLGFFLARQGSFDSFLYTDTSDNSVTDAAFGAGTGVQTQFQLSRAYGYIDTFTEPVQNVAALTNIKVNGVTKTLGADYSVDANGLVTFTAAPAFGASLTWTGTYYYRVRFARDASEYSQFMKDLWEGKKLELIGAPGNKI